MTIRQAGTGRTVAVGPQIHEVVSDGVLREILAMAARTEARKAFWAEERRKGLQRVREQKAKRQEVRS